MRGMRSPICVFESREPGVTDRVTKKTAVLSWCPCLLKVAHPFEVKVSEAMVKFFPPSEMKAPGAFPGTPNPATRMRKTSASSKDVRLLCYDIIYAVVLTHTPNPLPTFLRDEKNYPKREIWSQHDLQGRKI